jgi:hypothetical protein
LPSSYKKYLFAQFTATRLLTTASSRSPLVAHIDDSLKSLQFITMPHNRLASKKGQPVANFVFATLGNLQKMRHDVA